MCKDGDCITWLDSEETTVQQFPTTNGKVSTETREELLDKTIDPDIFQNLDITFSKIQGILCFGLLGQVIVTKSKNDSLPLFTICI